VVRMTIVFTDTDTNWSICVKVLKIFVSRCRQWLRRDVRA
jgi:hypothetical protein